MLTLLKQSDPHKVVAALLFCFMFVASALPVLAAPYGESTYGGGEYNVGLVPTATPTTSGSSGSSGKSNKSSSNTSSGPKECTDQKPGGTPELFQIDRNGSAVTLHVTPSSDPYNSFFVSYGVGGSTEQYAEYFQYEKATGVMIHKVRDLDPNSTYSFRVQPMNGCMPGEWSNTLAAGTKSDKYFKYGITQMIVPARSLATTARNYVTGKTNSTTTNTESANTEKTEELEKTATTQATKATTTTQPSMPTPAPEPKQGGIINWFKRLFQ